MKRVQKDSIAYNSSFDDFAETANKHLDKAVALVGRSMLFGYLPSGTWHPYGFATFDYGQLGNLPDTQELSEEAKGWHIVVHVWPKGFRSEDISAGPNLQDRKIFAPPMHSHQFEFVSQVVAGNYVQYIYKEATDKQLIQLLLNEKKQNANELSEVDSLINTIIRGSVNSDVLKRAKPHLRATEQTRDPDVLQVLLGIRRETLNQQIRKCDYLTERATRKFGSQDPELMGEIRAFLAQKHSEPDVKSDWFAGKQYWISFKSDDGKELIADQISSNRFSALASFTGKYSVLINQPTGPLTTPKGGRHQIDKDVSHIMTTPTDQLIATVLIVRQVPFKTATVVANEEKNIFAEDFIRVPVNSKEQNLIIKQVLAEMRPQDLKTPDYGVINPEVIAQAAKSTDSELLSNSSIQILFDHWKQQAPEHLSPPRLMTFGTNGNVAKSLDEAGAYVVSADFDQSRLDKIKGSSDEVIAVDKFSPLLSCQNDFLDGIHVDSKIFMEAADTTALFAEFKRVLKTNGLITTNAAPNQLVLDSFSQAGFRVAQKITDNGSFVTGFKNSRFTLNESDTVEQAYENSIALASLSADTASVSAD